MTVLSFHFSFELPSLTFPTFGAQIFGSPPIVFFFSFSSTVELALPTFSRCYTEKGCIRAHILNGFFSLRVVGPTEVMEGMDSSNEK